MAAWIRALPQFPPPLYQIFSPKGRDLERPPDLFRTCLHFFCCNSCRFLLYCDLLNAVGRIFSGASAQNNTDAAGQPEGFGATEDKGRMRMFDKGKREERYEKENAEFNKMLLWLVGAVVVELIILLVKQVYVNMILGVGLATALMYFFQVFAVLGAVLTVAGIVWAVVWHKKGKGIVLPCALTAVAAGLWVLALFTFSMFEVGLNIVMILPAVAAVLIVIFFLYQRVFFLNALVSAGGLVALWLHRQYYSNHPSLIMALFVAGFVALAAVLVLTFVLRAGDGKLGSVRVMPAGTSYVITWITCGVTALTMALTLILGVSAGLYLLFALVGWVFIQAVFFTVKLM